MNKPIEELVGETDLRELLEGIKENKREIHPIPQQDKTQVISYEDKTQVLIKPSTFLESYNDDNVTYLKGIKILKSDYNVLGHLFDYFSRDDSIFFKQIQIRDSRVNGLTIDTSYRNVNHISNLNHAKRLDCLESLDYRDFNSDKFPAVIFELRSLCKLRILKGYGMINIPEELYNLDRLKELKISAYYPSQIPKGITKLKYLENIDLSLNRIEELPEEILELPNLKSLDLRYNCLGERFGMFFYKDKKTKIIVNQLKKKGVKVRI